MLPPGSPAPVLRCQKWFHALGEKGTELGFQKIWNHVKTVDFLVQRERITGCYPADFSFCWIPDVCKRNTVRCTLFIFLHSAFLASSSLWHDCIFFINIVATFRLLCITISKREGKRVHSAFHPCRPGPEITTELQGLTAALNQHATSSLSPINIHTPTYPPLATGSCNQITVFLSFST